MFLYPKIHAFSLDMEKEIIAFFTDYAYTLEKLLPALQRGIRELTIASFTLEQLVTHSFPAFLGPHHINDGTIEEFRRWFTHLAKFPEVIYLDAWKDEQLKTFVCK